jgi:ribonuclease HIII
MSFSIEFCHPIEKAVDQLKSKLEKANVICTSEAELNKGAGIKIIGTCKDHPVVLALYFNRAKGFSTKIVVEKYPQTEIAYLRAEINAKERPIQKSIPIHATITVADCNCRKAIKEALISSKLGFTEITKTEHMEYLAKLQHDGHEVTLTQYLTGALLIQGAYTSLIDTMVNIIDQKKPLTLEERALFFLPAEAESGLRDAISKKTNSIKTELVIGPGQDDDWIRFLFSNDHKTFITGETLTEILEQQPKQLPEYNFLVAIYSKVFEGFLIKLLINKEFFTFEQYRKNPDIPDIGNTLRKGKLKKYIRDTKRHGYIIEDFISVWEGARCKEMHSDPAENMQILSVNSLANAKDKIGGIKTCMKEAFEILVKFGLTDADIAASTPMKDAATTVIIKDETSRVDHNGYIGTDESGKGDYFGPLVIAGVFLDPATEKRLAEAGVRDSKKISDTRIYEFAAMIRSYLSTQQYAVVSIGPEKYNELYGKIGNLNNLLAWGHARVIENILSGIRCDKVIADQFGDESFIQQALMSKGKKIKLVQMPKAEQFTAVAAASILARECFLIRLSELGKTIGIELLKGASPEVENTAKQIIRKNGFDALNKLAKLHFKTTEKLR